MVFGFCEGYWDEPGQRVLELKIDGVSKKIVDPVAEVGKNGVLLVTVEAADTTGDGNIDIEVAVAPSQAGSSGASGSRLAKMNPR